MSETRTQIQTQHDNNISTKGNVMNNDTKKKNATDNAWSFEAHADPDYSLQPWPSGSPFEMIACVITEELGDNGASMEAHVHDDAPELINLTVYSMEELEPITQAIDAIRWITGSQQWQLQFDGHFDGHGSWWSLTPNDDERLSSREQAEFLLKAIGVFVSGTGGLLERGRFEPCLTDEEGDDLPAEEQARIEAEHAAALPQILELQREARHRGLSALWDWRQPSRLTAIEEEEARKRSNFVADL
ncbi:MAG: hypothetical protein ACYSXF_07300 [Planctomycetota bacterium]|jgi:hypothetical protein